MYPTRADVRNSFWGLLDDPTGAIYVDFPEAAPTISVFQPAFKQAYAALYSAFLNAQCPRIELETTIAVNPFTTELTPADMGIPGFGDFIWLRERALGSTGKYRELEPLDDLPQRQANALLRNFVWRNNTFYFVGATQPIELQIKYDTSAVAPVDDTTVIMVDDCESFLANYAAGVAGPRKGDNEIAARCWEFAVGPKYSMGVIGGELFRLIQPLVRSRQNVQIAHRPYQAFRGRGRGYRFAAPYIQAQQGSTGGGEMNVPIQYSTFDGSIVGPVDGVNAIFWLNTGAVSSLLVFRNGVAQTYGVDYTNINNQITFLQASIPQPGDIVTAEAFNSGTPQAVAPPDRTMTGQATLSDAMTVDGGTTVIGTVTVPNAIVGNGVVVAPQNALPAGVRAFGSVTLPNTVTIEIWNLSGGPVTLPPNVYYATAIQ